MSEENQVNLTVVLPKNTVMMPAWSVKILIILFIFSCLTNLFLWIETTRGYKEIRILQLHVMDVENVLIRQGLGKRGEDFANWYNINEKTKEREENGR